MIRGMNKKGAEDGSGTIPKWLLAFVFLLIAAGIIYGFSTPIKNYINSFSDQTSEKVITCNAKASLPDNGAGYCAYEEVTLSGKTEYINCIDSRITSRLNVENQNRFTCDSNIEYKKELCKTVILTGVSNVVVNGESLSCLDATKVEGMSCSYLNGIVLSDTIAKCGSDKPKLVNINITLTTTERCCIALA